MSDTTWNIYVEMRKELLETQKILAKVLAYKIVFVTTVLALIAAYIHDLHNSLLAIPAFAAIFFDFVILHYSFTIKRISAYTRDCVEPALKKTAKLPGDFVLWQQYLRQPKTRLHLVVYGIFGITLLTGIVAIVALFSVRNNYALVLIISLLIFAFMDVFAYLESQKLGKHWADNNLEFEPATEQS